MIDYGNTTTRRGTSWLSKTTGMVSNVSASLTLRLAQHDDPYLNGMDPIVVHRLGVFAQFCTRFAV